LIDNSTMFDIVIVVVVIVGVVYQTITKMKYVFFV